MRLFELGARIRAAREAREMSQAALADAAGVSRVTISQLEGGWLRDLGYAKVEAIARCVGLTLAAITRPTRAGSPFNVSVWGSGPSDVYALGTFDLLHYDGTTWTNVDIHAGGDEARVFGTSASDVWVSSIQLAMPGGRSPLASSSDSEPSQISSLARMSTWVSCM